MRPVLWLRCGGYWTGPVVATVALKGGGFIAEVKARPDVQVWELTRANRNDMPRDIADMVDDIWRLSS